MKEVWKDIEGYEGLYQVSNLGRVKSLNYHGTGKEEALSLIDKGNGYLVVGLCCCNKTKIKLVHRLVAEAFIPNPNNLPIINHIDENKLNNCVDNLEWCTYQYNAEYSLAKPVLQFDLEGNFIQEWKSVSEVELNTGIHIQSISACCMEKYGHKTAGGYIWKYKP